MTPSAVLARTRLAVAAAFFAQGFTFISLTTRLPQLMGRHDIGTLGQSLAMLTIVLLAGVGSLVAERAAARRASAATLRAGLAAIALGAAAIVLAPSIPLLVPALALYGLGLGLVDAGSNMQAVAVEAGYGRPILPSFHGAWTLGGIVAAAITLTTAALPLAAIAAVAVLPAAVATAPFLVRDQQTTTTSTPPPDVPWRAIAVVGAALVIFYMVDTAATTWGPTYLERVTAAPQQLLALATLPYLIATGVARLAGDRVVQRFGPVAVLRLGSVLACGALAVIVFAPVWPMTVIGFALLGVGVAVVAPLSFSAAARIAGGADLAPAARQARVDSVIARFNQFNYVGALLGAVMTGVVGAGDLRWGFALPMVLVLALIPLAGRFAADEPSLDRA
jgi:fucose permease